MAETCCRICGFTEGHADGCPYQKAPAQPSADDKIAALEVRVAELEKVAHAPVDLRPAIKVIVNEALRDTDSVRNMILEECGKWARKQNEKRPRVEAIFPATPQEFTDAMRDDPPA